MPNDGTGIGKLANLGLYPGVGLGIGAAIGYWLDFKFGWGNIGLIAGAVIGLMSGFYLLLKEAIRSNNEE